METCEQIITYWLCPVEPVRTELSAIIRDLAERFDGPAFEPHVTIYSTSAEREDPAAVLRQVVTTWSPFRLAVRGLDYSEEFTKTLFVQFAPDDDLARLGKDLRRASTSQNDYELNPHLSLIYKNLDQETKRRLARSLTLPFSDVTFDRVKAVISPATLRSSKDVDAWRMVAEQKLTG